MFLVDKSAGKAAPVKWPEEPSLAGLARWLEKQEPSETYNYSSLKPGRQGCAVTQYLATIGYTYETCPQQTLCRLDMLASNWFVGHSYGALLNRVRAAMAQ